MQYQVYNAESNELIAWIDTKKNDVICKDGYEVRAGINLQVIESEED